MDYNEILEDILKNVKILKDMSGRLEISESCITDLIKRAEKAESQLEDAMGRMKNIVSGDIYPCEVCKYKWNCALPKPQRRCGYFEYRIKEE